MISLRQLLEQLDINAPDAPNELDNSSSAPSVGEYIQKADSYMSGKGNESDWYQLRQHLATYYDKIADDSLKQRMFNELGNVTADPTDVNAMNSQIGTNIYLTDVELNNLGRVGGITTKQPYNIPLVNKTGQNPGAGELSFQLAHPNIIWVGKNHPGDAVYKAGDQEYVIDVKDDRKISPEVPGVDIVNKTKYKLFFDNTKFLELQKKVEIMLKFIRAYDSHSTRMNIFNTEDAVSDFDNVRDYFIKLFSGQYSYVDWLRQMQRINREHGIGFTVEDSDMQLQRKQRLLIIAQKGGSDTIKFQCFLNKLRNFVAKHHDSINYNSIYGNAFKYVITDEIFEPNWFIRTLQDSVKLNDDNYLDNLSYDYILVASKIGGKPMYFSSKKENATVVSLYAKRKINFADSSKTQGNPDALIMNFNDYLDTITYNNLNGVDPCKYDTASKVKKAKVVRHLARNNK
jgi:hypothetical protein